MSLFAPKYLDAHPFALDHVPGLEQRVAALHKWEANLRSGRVHKAKEEALQADFLNLIFGEVLGYDYQHAHLWHLEKEQKSNTDGTKADGALGYFRQLAGQRTADVRVVIELKDARADLDKPQNRATDRRTPVEQAFGYASKVGGRCRWVIVSNFVELRLYPATDQSQYERFDLGTLPGSRTELARFFRLLLREQLLAEHGESPIDHLYRERQAQEREISENFYGEYKQARLDLLAHLRQQNPAVPELLLFNKAQKLLDRVVFVCFCEDKAIIPPLTFRGLLRAVREDRFNRSESRIYERVKGLFRAIDEGYPDAGINKFNGGLFAPDADLDNLRILDAILEPIIALEVYDFDSDLNVNILGHIFEQSIADIEELKAQLVAANPGPADPTPSPSPVGRGATTVAGRSAPLPTGEGPGVGLPRLSKRKKDGIFYTPEYITRYMVREAVGGWLHQRYQQAGIEALPALPPAELTPQGQPLPELLPARKGALTRLLARHTEAWQQYRQALLEVRVLDPACGSGAFLNQVFDYLHQEGQRVNRELARLSGGQTTVFDLDKHILTHNLFGVDLNAESVEITRLSLWLKTANKYNPLTALDANIRTGNSLIADPAVAGALAFDWNTEFAEVMGGGGFDVVIGNPPYLGGREWKEANGRDYQYFVKNYEVAEYQFDMYALFWERAIKLTKTGGQTSFITPNTWLNNQKTALLRKFILDNTFVKSIADYSRVQVFADAVVLPVIATLQKGPVTGETAISKPLDANAPEVSHFVDSESWKRDPLYILNIDLAAGDVQLREKIELDAVELKELALVKFGVKIYETGKGTPKQLASDAPNHVFEASSQIDASYRPFLEGKDIFPYEIYWQNRWIKYGRNLAAPREKELFEGERLLIRRIVGTRLIGAYIDNDFVTSQLLQIVKPHEPRLAKFLLVLLNSSLMAYYFRKKYNRQDKTFPEIRIYELASLPIRITDNPHPFIDAADSLLALTAQVQQQRQQFLTFLQVKLGLAAPSRKLHGWDALDWPAFAAELKKAKVVLTLAQEAEWLPLLQQRQQALRALTAQATTQDRALDQLVYALYGLTEAEIALVEGK